MTLQELRDSLIFLIYSCLTHVYNVWGLEVRKYIHLCSAGLIAVVVNSITALASQLLHIKILPTVTWETIAEITVMAFVLARVYDRVWIIVDSSDQELFVLRNRDFGSGHESIEVLGNPDFLSGFAFVGTLEICLLRIASHTFSLIYVKNIKRFEALDASYSIKVRVRRVAVLCACVR